MNTIGNFLRQESRAIAGLGWALIVLGVSVGGYRAVTKYQEPGPFSHDNAGFCDLHNGLYFPTVALLEGVSPYGEVYATTFPVDRQVPFFSPGFFALHAPLAMLPLRVAEYVYFAMIIAMTFGIGYLVTCMVGKPQRRDLMLLVTGVLMVSRGGQSTLYVAYFTMEIVLATLLAIHWSNRRPWLAGLALVFVSAKPTYILPLGFLLLARCHFKALVIGAALSITAAAIPLVWLVANSGSDGVIAGVSKIIEDVRATQDVHMLVFDELPVNTWTRLDAPAIIAKWLDADPSQDKLVLFMLVILAMPMLVLFRRARAGIDDGAAGMTGLLMLSAFLSSVYHQSYDAMVLIAPLVGIFVGCPKIWQNQPQSRLSPTVRTTLAVLIMMPLFSYFSARTVIGRLSPSPLALDILTSLSGVSVALLMIAACYLAWQEVSHRKPPST